MKKYRFYDMCSGGYLKVRDLDEIFIDAEDYDEAVAKFEAMYDYDPTGTTCDCCGPDYSIGEWE